MNRYPMPRKTGRPGDAIIASGWIAIAGTVQLVKQEREKLQTYFPASMIDIASGFEQLLDTTKVESVCGKAGMTEAKIQLTPEFLATHTSAASRFLACGEGGIFAGLWELAENLGVGISVDLRKLPVRQETIEICNYLDVNPYKLDAGGCMLMTTDRSDLLLERLEEAEVPAVKVGKITDKVARIIRNGDSIRYLERPR